MESPSNGQAQIDLSSSQSGGQEINQGIPHISEAQKPLYSKDDLEQVLAEALRLAIDIVRAKKAYTPAAGGQQSSYYQNSYANRQNYEARPGPQVQYQSGGYGAARAPPGYYR